MTNPPNVSFVKHCNLRILPRAIVLFLGAMALLMLLVAIVFYDKPIGGDFLLRYNEMTAVMDGTDPYLIWSGTVHDDRFYPYNHPELQKSPDQSRIHAYTPWSYTYVMPLFVLLSRSAVWKVFQIVQFMALILIGYFAFHRSYVVKHSVGDGLLGVAAAFALGMSYGTAFIYGNYSILIAALFVMMIACLNRGYDVLAGVCWAFVMTKPQCGLLIAIPLVMQRKWKTLFTAVFVCCAASLIPAYLCGRSPVDMILQVRKLGAGFYSGGTALFPAIFVDKIFGPGCIEAREFLLPVNAVIGIALCCLACWTVRKSRDWLVLLSPAIIFASAWTYLGILDRCIFSVPAIALMAWWLKNDKPGVDCTAICGLSVLSLCGVLHLIICDGILQKIFAVFERVYPNVVVHTWLWWIDAFVMLVLVLGTCLIAPRIARDGASNAN